MSELHHGVMLVPIWLSMINVQIEGINVCNPTVIISNNNGMFDWEIIRTT
jgi:hypothetical protein